MWGDGILYLILIPYSFFILLDVLIGFFYSIFFGFILAICNNTIYNSYLMDFSSCAT